MISRDIHEALRLADTTRSVREDLPRFDELRRERLAREEENAATTRASWP